MAKGTKKTAKKEVVIDKNVVSDATREVDVKLEVIEEPKTDEKVWVSKWEDLVKVEGVNQTARGKQYYGIKRK